MSTPPAPSGAALPRRALFTTAVAGAAGVVAATAAASPAAAAPGTTAWVLGGNSGVTTSGSNFLGPTNAGAPLVFKTCATGSTTTSERMRIAPTGNIGIGTTAPDAKLHVVTGGVALRASTSGGTTSRGVSATATAGTALFGQATTGVGADVRSTSGTALQATSTNYYGVIATGPSGGVLGTSANYGVIGNGNNTGGYFSGPTGVYGSTAGVTAVLGANTNVDSGVGVRGTGRIGVHAQASVSGTAQAVLAEGGQYSVYGSGGTTAGVRGDSGYVGVWGQGTAWGLYGAAVGTTGQNYGVYGTTSSPDGYAMFAQGRVHVNGTLSKSAGSFKIDHPLDPDNRWLSHSFVESPDMMNVYNGTTVTDDAGNATVALPEYFEALNRDFRYQLTVIGDFAQVAVSREVGGNSFDIRTDRGGVKVSWQVTGIRHDPYAEAHPIVVEEDKSDADKDAAGSTQRRGSTAGDLRAPTGPDVEIPEAKAPPAPTLP
ncbi:MAG: hypothetical protein PIR02_11940 [Microbacterium enclense]